MSAASEITRKAKSNLAFALRVLPREQQDDMVVFYAFCRTIDDLADSTELSLQEKQSGLRSWIECLNQAPQPQDELQREVIALRERRQIPNELLLAIIDGCSMDLQPQRFATWEELSGYIWKVACAVGLGSIQIFGCQDAASERYAIALGHALQLTNILRDIREDLENGQRIYLPLEDLARFGYTAEDFSNKIRDDRFLALMEYEAQRAEKLYEQAAAEISAQNRDALLPAEVMADIYRTLLGQMRADGFRVFEKRYRLSKARKLAIASKHLLNRRLSS